MSIEADWVYDDGGRAAAGFRGRSGDCAVRALAIAGGLGYVEAKDLLEDCAEAFSLGRSREARRQAARPRGGRSLAAGTFTPIMAAAMKRVGWDWVNLRGAAAGSSVGYPLLDDDTCRQIGRGVLNVRKHFTAVVGGVIRDTFHPGFYADGTERRLAVYGVWLP